MHQARVSDLVESDECKNRSLGAAEPAGGGAARVLPAPLPHAVRSTISNNTKKEIRVAFSSGMFKNPHLNCCGPNTSGVGFANVSGSTAPYAKAILAEMFPTGLDSLGANIQLTNMFSMGPPVSGKSVSSHQPFFHLACCLTTKLSVRSGTAI